MCIDVLMHEAWMKALRHIIHDRLYSLHKFLKLMYNTSFTSDHFTVRQRFVAVEMFSKEVKTSFHEKLFSVKFRLNYSKF